MSISLSLTLIALAALVLLLLGLRCAVRLSLGRSEMEKYPLDHPLPLTRN